MIPARPDYAILFVCTGNICRSPTAHGVLLKQLQLAGLQNRVWVDSAGTHGYHVGDPPDERSQAHAARRGYDLSPLRARRVQDQDFARHDLILAMDHGHLALLAEHCPPELSHKLQAFTRWCQHHRVKDVPDPYYGDAQGFEQVLDLVEDGCAALLAHVRAQLG
ncbi:phosphotyrosine protein phosphatase [Hylemonella gracilis str. Niagara R]|uniref:Phosphotyrosine protein phosphatase n=1 Tax=Hylemonella gracilis str. Niagara R TaxID=1458275 RepID=A0A016XDN4_9BURK|nr:low molecular weight protein-tyrosine-phosphatase [Hylemonella gracilis]EYC49682.1 phosphotyrosine protein phosphatase [Hylemonella gracilis str. Niagara R]